jgi:hypothetical protein
MLILVRAHSQHLSGFLALTRFSLFCKEKSRFNYVISISIGAFGVKATLGLLFSPAVCLIASR